MILFIDFDYFYAQVEEILNPGLKGKPVAVCVFSGRTKFSGAVATSNYEARKLGVRAGIPISKAMDLSGGRIILLPMRKDVYIHFSRQVMDFLTSFSHRYEIASIDEIYIEVPPNITEYEAFGKKLKQELLSRFDLRVTVGIGENRVVAKVAADLSKPNGLMYVAPDRTIDFLRNLPVGKTPYIGDKTAEKLESIGIAKLGDLLRVDPSLVRRKIGGARAQYLYSLVNGTYREGLKDRKRKSFNRILTLPFNTRDEKILLQYLAQAAEEAFNKAGGLPMEVGVVAVMEDIETVIRNASRKRAVTRAEVMPILGDLLKRLLAEDSRNIRRIGVRLAKIVNPTSLDKFLK